MPKSTPLYRKPSFVFGPPIAMAIIGAVLIIQGALASPVLPLVQERIDQRKASGWVVPTLEFAQYDFIQSQLSNPASELVVVNKQRKINPSEFEPAALVVVRSSKALDNWRELELTPAAAAGLEAMAKAMFDQGQGQLVLNSAYRTYEYQENLFNEKASKYGTEEADLRSARPGYSEHQTGLAADVSVPSQGCAIMSCFGDTAAGKWIVENGWKFGYILRYEKDTQEITGYSYEPWHIRFVGTTIAKKYAESGMNTLEEFWNLPAAPGYAPEIAASTID